MAEGRRLLARSFLSRKVMYAFPEQRWMRWYGVGCILFPGYLVASAMWSWLGDLRAFGVVGGVVALVAVFALVVAVAREVGRVLRTALDAGMHTVGAGTAAVVLLGLAVAAGTLVSAPSVTVSGYVRVGQDVRLVLPVRTDADSVARPARMVLRSNGLFLHDGDVEAALTTSTRFGSEVVPFAAVAPVRTSMVEFRALSAPLEVTGQDVAVRHLDPDGQALVAGPTAPLWRVLWDGMF